ncbi:unnamed protein product [Pedinophyceae sp. YPF-701]|nr:unnamed protein product [Pedinophyceae sp. YPF-701]
MVSKKKGASKKAGQASKGETVGVLTLSYEEAKARLEHLEGLEQVSQNDLVEYYGVDQDPGELHARPSTQRKGNPNCLAGMVPSPEGTRVKGIWSKDHPSLCKPGDDPKQLRRSAPSQPTGLTNLGATCYVNALVQALFYVPPLRKGILHANDVLRADPAISQLRRIFAMMQAGPFSKVDSKPLVSTLRLPEDVQQDLQEFKTFLFGYLEERFAEAATQYDDVMKAFRGRESWAMRCEKCKKFSSKSTEVQRFYEVQVEPEHSRGLPVCLERAFASEEVEGVNCEHCKARRTFTRFHAVRELPEYLVLSVKRYKWDLRSGERKKINSQMQFPTSLDMGRILETSIYATDFGEELQKHCPYQPG